MARPQWLLAWSPSWSLLCIVVTTVACLGCGSSPVDDQLTLDNQIEEQWIASRTVVDAIPFLESGGHYEDLEDSTDVSTDVSIDKMYVLPLIKQFRDELSLKAVAVLDEPKFAMAIVIELPQDPLQRQRIGHILQVADDAFPGLLMDNWGQKWLSLDFLEERELGALRGAGALELIQKEQDLQRQMGK